MNETRDTRLANAIRLREFGQAEEALPLLVELAAEFPDDAQVQYQAAWVHDQLGLENEAVPYYERALELGVDEPDRQGLLLGLGSTYRNVGKIDQSLAILEQGVRDYPDEHALRCFLALARLDHGEQAEALALMLDVVLETSDSPSIERYRRALTSYRDLLRGIEE